MSYKIRYFCMVKSLTYILAIYMVSFTAFFSLVDTIGHSCCSSTIVALDTSCTESDSEAVGLEHNSDSDNHDCCGGDLCSCSCCHATVFYPSGIASSLHKTTPQSFQFSPYRFLLSNGEQFSIWQPPSFIS